MKNFKYILSLFFSLAIVLSSCEEKEYEFGDIKTPSNISITASIVGQDASNPFGDGTGKVNFTASASDAITYKYLYEGKEVMSPDGKATINFSKTGVFTYVVTVEAIGTAGSSSTQSIEVEVLAEYEPPADLLEMLVGDGEKVWRLKAEGAGHFGVGPPDGDSPIWWAAAPFDKADWECYDDRFIFRADGSFTHITNGQTFGKLDAMASDLDGDQGLEPDGNGEAVYAWGDYNDVWTLTAPDGQETLSFNDIGYHGFYVGGTHSYAILERTATSMTLKTIGADGLGWWAILTTEAAPEEEEKELVWSDEFDTDGAPDAANWTYDLGAGGWGNGEAQTYTDNAENVIVEGGVLKITAKADGGSYTSARLKTQGLQSFKYGRIDVRAKLPASQGTWPAIWMLGDSFSTVGWPRCGEIDIMEQTGADKNTSLGTLHWFDEGSSSNASYGETTAVANASTEFHVYSLEWDDTSLKILVDDVQFFEMSNDAALPFNDNFFVILNIAMGGSLGGTIDPAFTEDTMEIDYVRVYQ